MPLPTSFASPLHLPFNGACLREKFRPAAPDADPGGEGRWLLLRGNEMLLPPDDPPLLPRQVPEILLTGDAAPLFIGAWEGEPCRALAVARQSEPPAGWMAQNLLAPEPHLPIDLLSLGGAAGQILHWVRNSRFCPRCGDAAVPLPGGWGKRCAACGSDHFPHIAPCAIVLVHRPGEVLLTRKAEWPPGRYSLVAGFLDFGECLEETAVREVLEETGVGVRNVRYVGSQNWPFPSQLMAGFTAEYAGGEVRVAEEELEDARWFPAAALPLLPPRRSIARYLIDHHLQG